MSSKFLCAAFLLIVLVNSVISAPAIDDEELEEVYEPQPSEHRTGRQDNSGVKQEGRVWRIPLVKKKLLLLKFKKLGALTTLPLLPLLLRNANGEAQIVQVLPVSSAPLPQSTYALPNDLLQEQVQVEVAEDGAPGEEESSFGDNTEVIEIDGDSDKPMINMGAKKISGYSSFSGLQGLQGLQGLSGFGNQGILQGLGGQSPVLLYALPTQVEYGRAAPGHHVKARRRLVRI